MQKNVASQKWYVFAFDETTNIEKTGDAANITANLYLDGVVNAVDDTNPTELENGYYAFDITQAESNADYILITPASSTANIQVIGTPGSFTTTPPNWNTMGIESDGDITKVNLVATTTTNTDMVTEPPTAVQNRQEMDSNSTQLTAILNRIGDFAGTGLNTVKGFFQAMFRKDAGVAVGNTPSEINEIENGTTGNYDGATESNEAITDRGDAAWITATGFNTTTPDVAGTAASLHSTTDGKVDALQTDIGDFSGRTNDQSLLDVLGVPDVAGKDLTTLLVTDRLDNGTFGLSALQTLLAAIPTTAMRGTDSAALASVATEARLAELDAANLPTDIAAIPTTAMRGTDSAALASVATEARLAELDAPNLPADVDGIKTATDRLPEAPLKNTALNDLTFLMVDETDFATPETGLTVTGQVSKDGGAFAGVAGSIAEIANGIYAIDASAADMNADLLIFRFSATGAADTFITIKTTS